MSKPFLAMYAVIAILILADAGIVAVRLTSGHPIGGPVAAQSGSNPASGHPCNHGSYVSRAAHQHKGGGYVKRIAQSDLGKNKSCSEPLPQD